jgi:integrase
MVTVQLQNFFKVSMEYLGVVCFTLYQIRSTGEAKEYRPFTLFVERLIESGYAWRSIEQYSTSVANFVDYLYCAVDRNSVGLSEIKLVYRTYHEFLVEADGSPNQKLYNLASQKKHKPILRQSSGTYHAGVDSFLKFCDQLCTERDQYRESGIAVEPLDDEDLIVVFGLITPATLRQRERKIKTDRGEEVLPNNRLSTHISLPNRNEEPIAANKYFPLGHMLDLLRNTTSDRDRALYAIMAASSIRVSEAMQLLAEDIDFVKRKVFIVNPWSRRNFNSAYRGLSYFEKKQLAWKGRSTKHTLLLEPYAGIFFETLELFFNKNHNSGNNFLFCTKNGRPLFLSDYSRVVLDPFKRAARPIYEALGLSLQSVGPHSLRHSYCYYMLNFVQRNSRIGMTPHELIQLTGHANVQSLEPYAKIEFENIFEEISVSNDLFEDAAGKTEAEYHVTYLERRLKEWRRLVKKEQDVKNDVEENND